MVLDTFVTNEYNENAPKWRKIFMRKYKHRNNAGECYDKDGKRIPPRRQHGLVKAVQIKPSVVQRAEKRRSLYAHSSATT